jgi:hypothetical protein
MLEKIKMANCNKPFIAYHQAIKLTTPKYTELKNARDHIRRLISAYFRKHHPHLRPVFKTQGSFVMRTIVSPQNGECDIDDGIYLKGLADNIASWPAPRTVLGWIHAAVAGHFPGQTHMRRACIQVTKPGQYRIDLPVFATHNRKPFVADSGWEGWHKSDTIELTKWFVTQFNRHDVQLKRLVCYIKGWADHQSAWHDLPSNLILSLYTVLEYQPTRYDDLAFIATVNRILRKIKRSYKLFNPMEPKEMMTRRLTDKQKHDGITALTGLSQAAQQALTADNQNMAERLWQKQFGPRFILSSK